LGGLGDFNPLPSPLGTSSIAGDTICCSEISACFIFELASVFLISVAFLVVDAPIGATTSGSMTLAGVLIFLLGSSVVVVEVVVGGACSDRSCCCLLVGGVLDLGLLGGAGYFDFTSSISASAVTACFVAFFLPCIRVSLRNRNLY
jgi:hypothetical protein